MTWQERIRQIAERVREPDLMDVEQIEGQVNLPYFKKNHVEDHLRAVALEMLRELPEDELMAVGSTAISELTGPAADDGGYMVFQPPLTVIRVLSCRIDENPAVYAECSNFFQRVGGGTRTSNVFTFLDSYCAFIGTEITLVVIVEPTLAEFRANAKIMPPGKELEWIDRAIKRMMIEDYEPQGRA